jgi:hypothetical protein
LGKADRAPDAPEGEPFSGVRFRIDAVYQRTAAELAARGSPLWMILHVAELVSSRLVTEFERYLTTEIAADHVDGLLSRREAIRRLGRLGLSGAAASALLAACATEKASTTRVPTSPSCSSSTRTARQEAAHGLGTRSLTSGPRA